MRLLISLLRLPVRLVFVAACVLPGMASADALRTLEDHVRQAGFEPVYPLAAGISPGALYSVTKGEGGLDVPDDLCVDAFLTANPPPKAVTLANATVSSSSDLKASLGLLSGLFKNVGDASGELDANGATKGSIAFGNPNVMALPAVIDSKGSRRQVSTACADGLKAYFDPTTGKPTRDIFLLIRTLSVADVTYTVTVTKGQSAGLKAALQKIFSFDFSYKPKSETQVQLIFKGSDADRQVVGVNRVKITRFKPDTMIGTAQTVGAIIAGERLPANSAAITLPIKP